MRQITVKYDGECSKCGASLEVGQPAMYEKRTGIFCVGCEPVEVEDIRACRQAKADRKAAKYEEWANKRETKARAQLNSQPSMRHDWAFITQPGHIPARARMIKADDRAYESLGKAGEFRAKAESLRRVQVKGDAERKRQAVREANDKLIGKGSRVHDAVFGEGVVLRVCKKSYRIKFKSKANGEDWACARDKSYVKLVS